MTRYLLRSVLWLAVLMLPNAWSDPGGYAVSPPAEMALPPKPWISSGISGPVLTTDWCASLAFHQTSHHMFAHPWAFHAVEDGLDLGYPDRTVVGENHFATPFPKDLKIRSTGLDAEAVLMDAYTDWSVTAWWEDSAFRVVMGHGMPFCYVLTIDPLEVVCSGDPSIHRLNDATLGVSVGGRNYGLFAPPGSQWRVDARTLSVQPGEAGMVSVAVLPDAEEETLAYFARFAGRKVVDTRVGWNYDQDASRIVTTYSVQTEHIWGERGTDVLWALYPHQWKFCEGPYTPYTFHSVRGPMKVLAGPSFVTDQRFTGLLPQLPLLARDGQNGFSHPTLQEMVRKEAARPDDQLIPPNGDTYWTGKALGRTAQLLDLADQTGGADSRDRLLALLKTRLEDWLTATPGEPAEYFYYHKPWGTLIGVKPSYGSNDHLNDHHFHYGYYLQAAATVARYDRAWAMAWKPMVDLIIRDGNSPTRNDPLFPFLRAFDIYAGHSWASGDAAFGSGNNQESSSEALQFAAGMAWWGAFTGDDMLRDAGLFLYTTEKNAVLNYWFDVDEDLFPDDYKHSMAAMVWGEKADYATWFSGEPECIHGINMLPITAASLFLGFRPEYVLKNYAEIQAHKKSGTLDTWLDILWQFLAFGDPEQALAAWQAHPAYEGEAGASRAYTYAWIHNLAAAGRVRGDITANTPCFAVFDRAGTRTYTAYHAGPEPAEVQFSDGHQLRIPPDKLVTHQGMEKTEH